MHTDVNVFTYFFTYSFLLNEKPAALILIIYTFLTTTYSIGGGRRFYKCTFLLFVNTCSIQCTAVTWFKAI